MKLIQTAIPQMHPILLLLLFYHQLPSAVASHFRFGTLSWASVPEEYLCSDGVSGPAPTDTPCHLPFSHGNRVHIACTGHNTSTSAAAPLCTNTCAYPNDGDCDDGGKASTYSVCGIGTDCADCGARMQQDTSSFHAGASGWCATSSRFDSATNWGSCKICTRTKKIRLKVHLAYRISGVGGSKWIRRGGSNNKVGATYSAGIYIDWGDRKRTVTNPMQVTSGGLTQSWADSLGEFTHDYSESFLKGIESNKAADGFLVRLTSCCRIGSLKNNRNGRYNIQTYVNLTHFRKGGSGPESSQVPMVLIPQSSAPQQFDVSGYSESAGGTAASGKLKFLWSSAVGR